MTADEGTRHSFPTLRMDDRVAWITGASRGLGRELALGFAAAGAAVVLNARSQEKLDEVAAEIRSAGGVAETLAGSIADPDTIERTMQLVRERFGRLDALVNNAGVSPMFVRAERMDQTDWRDVLEVNLTAPLACATAALPLLEARGGSVVNVSSIHGARAHERIAAYAASKGGLEMLTRSLAVEWATRGVRVNAVAPGYLETDLTTALREHPRWSVSLKARIPMGRFGTPAEVVPAALLLAGPAGSYITGTTVFIDGGWTAA